MVNFDLFCFWNQVHQRRVGAELSTDVRIFIDKCAVCLALMDVPALVRVVCI